MKEFPLRFPVACADVLIKTVKKQQVQFAYSKAILHHFDRASH